MREFIDWWLVRFLSLFSDVCLFFGQHLNYMAMICNTKAIQIISKYVDDKEE